MANILELTTADAKKKLNAYINEYILTTLKYFNNYEILLWTGSADAILDVAAYYIGENWVKYILCSLKIQGPW